MSRLILAFAVGRERMALPEGHCSLSLVATDGIHPASERGVIPIVCICLTDDTMKNLQKGYLGVRHSWDPAVGHWGTDLLLKDLFYWSIIKVALLNIPLKSSRLISVAFNKSVTECPKRGLWPQSLLPVIYQHSAHPAHPSPLLHVKCFFKSEVALTKWKPSFQWTMKGKTVRFLSISFNTKPKKYPLDCLFFFFFFHRGYCESNPLDISDLSR